jgi:hypothetical protein
MNERFKLLAEQARKKPLGNSWTYRLSGEFEQKFAELVVRECMSNLYLNGYDDAVMQIKQHFGIER